ncbi:hypothetical protein AB5J62_14320 [Amycolatopsis sp. cg5]|uniref:hypothetical protein n=1 Tax=Amycolatopsis sp. cg5 TaxID=3238802 RepID=UPI0035232423
MKKFAILAATVAAAGVLSAAPASADPVPNQPGYVFAGCVLTLGGISICAETDLDHANHICALTPFGVLNLYGCMPFNKP